MQRRFVGVLLLLSACAPASSIEAPDSAPPRILETGTGTEVSLRGESRVVETPIAAPADSVFLAVAGVIRELGAELNTYDPAGRVVGTQGFAAPRQLLGRRLSTYVSCGTNMSGEVADNARVRLNIATRVVPAQTGGSSLQTRLTAEARPTGGASVTLAGCSSTGALEAHIAAAVRDQLRR